MCFLPPGKITFNLMCVIKIAGLSKPWTVIDALIGYFVTFVHQVISDGLVMNSLFFDEIVGAHTSIQLPLLSSLLTYGSLSKPSE